MVKEANVNVTVVAAAAVRNMTVPAVGVETVTPRVLVGVVALAGAAVAVAAMEAKWRQGPPADSAPAATPEPGG